MAKQKILIVEDEVIVSTDLKLKLNRIGYDVPCCIRYAEDAFEAAKSTDSDLVLMDIRLKGEMDGTEAARQISEELEIPVIFLSAYSDKQTLNNAKSAAPFAYLTKPVRTEELSATIDIVLYKKEMEKKLKKSELRYRMIADFTHNWETWIGPGGEIEYVSPSCERITGYTIDDFKKNPDLILEIMDSPSSGEIEEFKSHNHDQHNSKVMEFPIITKSGEKRWIQHFCQAVYSPDGKYMGRRGSNIDITEKKEADEAREKLIGELEEALNNITTLKGLLPICCSCKKIRNDEGYWHQIESYIEEKSDLEFTHGICPECAKEKYPDTYKRKKESQ